MKCYNKDCTKTPKSFNQWGGMSTLMGTYISYDELGRPLNADMNYRTSGYACTCCGTKYHRVTKGWNTRLFYENDFAGYLGAFDDSYKEIALEDIDNTPDYVIEHRKQEDGNK